MRYRQGLPWDGTLVRLGLNALAALYRGTTAIESAIQQVVGSVAHADDLLAYVRTGETRSELLQRLVSDRGDSRGDVLRAFAELARAGGNQPATVLSASALDALTSAATVLAPNDSAAGARGDGGGGGVRFVER